MPEIEESRSISLVGSVTPIAKASAQPKTRTCSGPCGTEISQARLRAMPSARFCVSCQRELGDVPFIRRYDEAGADGEVHQTYFTSNPRLEAELHRRNIAATDESVRLEDLDTSTATKTPTPENTSVRATNLGRAVGDREDELHRASSSLNLESRALRKAA